MEFKSEASLPATHTNLFSLTTDRIDLVFPIAREADRQLSLDRWRRFAKLRVAADPSESRLPGVLLASRNSHIRGLAAYDVSEATGPDKVLKASHIVIVDRTRERHLEMDLLGGLMRIAESEKCNRICAELPSSSRWLHTRWSDPGGRVFRLPVECFALPDTTDTEIHPQATDVVNFRPRT